MPRMMAQQESSGKPAVDQGCPVHMYDAVCGRPIYHPSSDFRDERPVCLMHSHDPKKDAAAFDAEFESILTKAGNGEADFSQFVFPPAANFWGDFATRCLFRECIFLGAVFFDGAVFKQFADFAGAEFATSSFFIGATFEEGASFSSSKFAENAEFSQSRFRWVTFEGAKFSKEADFSQAIFIGNGDFSRANFSERASFGSAIFAQKADFKGSTFTDDAFFYATAFALMADFRVVRFRGSVEFRQTLFRGDTRLRERLNTIGNSDEVDNPNLPKEQQTSAEPGPLFSRASFEKPERAIFYQTYLGRALFHNFDLSKVVFSDVEWLKRGGSGRSAVFDEIVDPDLGYVLDPEYTFFPAGDLKAAPGSSNERNYRLLSELYQRLEKNYDSSGDYATAGDFHHGKMEMKRLETSVKTKKLRWFKRNLGLVAWYKHASEYGESYIRPAVWLLGIVFALGLLYPVMGLRYNGAKGGSVPPVLRYESSCPDQSTDRTCMGPATLAGNGLMASLQTATFQKDLTYEPAYPWGKLLALVELLLVSTLVGLFLLAVRRQFKR